MHAVTRLTLLTCLLVALSGCRSTPDGAGDGALHAGAAAPTSATRVVAIGDLHGDLAATRRALTLAGVIDASDRWIGGSTVVVQVGDQLDRGDDEPEILDLLERLDREATAAGGRVHALLGNHETMNVVRDFRYVTEDGWADYGGPEGRAAAFSPGGPAAARLATRDLILVLGDTVFVHGGLLPEHVAYGIDRINHETREWLAGERERPAITSGADSPLWSRHYSHETDAPACELLARTLAAIPARRMVVAHTVQPQGINAACGGLVWRVDVGLSRHYGGQAQVLELIGDQARVIGPR